MRQLLGIFFLLTSFSAVHAQTWQQVPIRTQAQKTAGLAGGEGFQAIQDIKYAPSNANILYMVTDTSGTWKGDDSGTTTVWQPKHNGFGSNGGQSLGIHPTDPNIVFVAGSNMTIGGSGPAGSLKAIFRTTDGGNAWTNVKTTTFLRQRASKGASLFAFQGTSTVYAATHGDGLLKSTDGGTTWSTFLSSPTYYFDLAQVTGTTTLYTTTNTGLYRINANASTQLITSGLPVGVNPRQIEVGSSSTSVAYVSLGSYGVYKTTNLGSSTPTFSAVNTSMANTVGVYTCNTLSVSPVDHNYLYVSYERGSISSPWGYFYTHDGGANWYVPTDMDVNDYHGSMDSWFGQVIGHSYTAPTATHPTNKNIAITLTTQELLRRTTDGGQYWTYSATGYTGGASNVDVASQISWNTAYKYMLFLADFGTFLTTDGGDTFTRKKATSGKTSSNGGAFDPTADSRIVVTTAGSWTSQRVMVSRNSGTTWTEVAGTSYDHKFIKFHPQDNNIVYADKFKFTNIQTDNTYVTLSRNVMGLYPGNGTITYSVASSGTKTTTYKSTDGGVTWTSPYPLIPVFGQVHMIAIAPNNENRIYVAMKGTTPANGAGVWIINDLLANGGTAVLKDADDGLSNDQFGEMNYSSVTVDPNNPNVVYAGQYSAYKGASNGVFRSTDSGATWSNISGNLTTWFTPNCLIVNPFDSYVYVGSFFGTWKLAPPGSDPGTGTTGAPLVTTGTKR